jgi:hypothetical protein
VRPSASSRDWAARTRRPRRSPARAGVVLGIIPLVVTRPNAWQLAGLGTRPDLRGPQRTALVRLRRTGRSHLPNSRFWVGVGPVNRRSKTCDACLACLDVTSCRHRPAHRTLARDDRWCRSEERGRAVQVFLSYRRGDVGGYAGRLADALLQRLGPNSVFQDVVAIAPGQDFTVAIDRALDDCDAVLAVIGPGWLTAAPPGCCPPVRSRGLCPPGAGQGAGPQRPRGPGPGRRRTLASGHRAARRTQGAGAAAGGGPARRNLAPGRRRLVRSLRGEPAVPTTRSRRWLVPGAAVAVALVALGAAAWWWGPGGGEGSGGGEQAEPLAARRPQRVRAGVGLRSTTTPPARSSSRRVRCCSG